MHPIEYLATLFTGAALVIAGYAFAAAGWPIWGLGLALVLLPVLGVPQWLARPNESPRPRFDPSDAED